jgi:6-phosphogluconolactonase (cycloisomerase 2 family)
MFALFPLIVLAVLSDARAHIATVTSTNSSPIAITSDDGFLWVVNRDNNSVSLFKVAGDANLKIAETILGERTTVPENVNHKKEGRYHEQ